MLGNALGWGDTQCTVEAHAGGLAAEESAKEERGGGGVDSGVAGALVAAMICCSTELDEVDLVRGRFDWACPLTSSWP